MTTTTKAAPEDRAQARREAEQLRRSTTKAVHTPGLGFCVCGHSRADHSSNDYDLTGKLGACLSGACKCEIFWGSKIESDAHLRAAAPEMLEALEGVVNLLDQLYWEMAEDAAQWPELIRAEAAIQKAKGAL